MDLHVWQTSFYSRADDDNRLSPAHLSLYFALLHEAVCISESVLYLKRDQIMHRSKICSRVTYHRCLRSLHAYGYIEYTPSYRVGDSKVRLVELDF
jgi:hypothetical protein